jgi:tetratricopeptide (TPR) repeat protein
VNQKRLIILSLSLLSLAAVALYLPRHKTRTGTLSVKKGTEMPAMSNKPVDRIDFLNAVFDKIRPPYWVSTIITADPNVTPADSLEKALKWAEETAINPLIKLLQSNLAEKAGKEESLTVAARALIFEASENKEDAIISGHLFQQGKRLLDRILASNNKNVPARNALIVYLSEYENQPMKFLATMKETLAIDSNNIETRFIRLNLLRKSAQWKKAATECEKLISLQPQNPNWYFQASDIYGFMGDSVQAKTFLEMAVKVQKNLK